MPYTGKIENTWLATLLSWVLPAVIFIGLWGFMMRRMGPQGGLMSIGKSKAKVYMEKSTGVTFQDVTGIDAEVGAIVARPHKRVRQLLGEKKAALEHLARRLLEDEVLEGAELQALLTPERETVAKSPYGL